MEILFLMGILFGFFLGILFSTFYTQVVTHKVMSILSSKYTIKLKNTKSKSVNHDDDEDDEENDPVNYWKPKGWKPDDEEN